LEFAHVNEVEGGTEAAAHLLKFDSVHGRWHSEVTAEEGKVRIGGSLLSFSEYATPAMCPGIIVAQGSLRLGLTNRRTQNVWAA